MSPFRKFKVTRRGFMSAVPAGLAAGCVGGQNSSESFPTGEGRPAGGYVECHVYPALPAALESDTDSQAGVEPGGDSIRVSNRFLEVEISPRTGLVLGILNRITGSHTRVDSDQVGLSLTVDGNEEKWDTSDVGESAFRVDSRETERGVEVSLETDWKERTVRLTYRLGHRHFWIERSLALEAPGDLRMQSLTYGRLEVGGHELRVLELGKFDRPRLLHRGEEGVFAGVGWWFYEVSEDGLYQNTGMDYECRQRFASEPWYLGIFHVEEGEPYPGWLWYKTFLQMRKLEHDQLPVSTCWNAGYGQWGIDIDNPSAPPYIEFVHDLGVREIGFGGGPTHPPIPSYIEKVKSPGVAQQNLKLCVDLGLSVGFLEAGWLKEKWEDDQLLQKMHNYLEEFAGLGFGSYFFDYFSTVDTFHAHRNVTEYFRAAHRKLNYVECHLGMAAYGPQFQREALVNHPTDLEGFDIFHFSSDWTTFLGFRLSRRQWQQRYQYLMPEYGLYYFATHYANREHPRLYEDPEPQQLLYKYESYNGISWNFHDFFGFRNSVAALSAFTPFYVFGHLDLKMPEAEKRFCQEFLKWVHANVETIRLGRVCHEDDKSCIVSKMRAGHGAIYVLNYGPGARRFRLQLAATPAGSFTIRQVYPERTEPIRKSAGDWFEIEVSGESLAILDVNDTFHGLPPQSRVRRVDLIDWHRTEEGWSLKREMGAPHPSAPGDYPLPREILSVDQLEDPPDRVVEQIGKGKLPPRYLEALDFVDGQRVATWKLAPWAFSGRVWFVYAPRTPLLLRDPLPHLTCNGTTTRLVPRVDDRFQDKQDYRCALLFADVTDSLKPRAENLLELSGAGSDEPSYCYLTWNENKF